ncbi:MAG: glycoside hydrolase family 3 C-terminal domain-containing protein, partial [Lachnospiraceae bacterium]|nr:glycoside hydrolase family 3 C-terminal domain-containing protein [Lachnospiraceae bacterium]
MKKVKWQRPMYMPCFPLGDNNSRITESDKHIQLSRRAAGEGAVLLKNEGALLPFEKGTKIAVFGKAQIDYVKGGGGSGNTIVSYVRNIYQGLKMKPEHLKVFDPLSFYYQTYVDQKYDEGLSNGMFDEAPIPADLLVQANEFTDTAVVTICRYSKESEDRRNDGTDTYFYLSNAEQEMVDTVTQHFSNVVVLLNVGAMIDTFWFAYNDKIQSAVMLWQGGMEGGLAAADILTGEVNPSGKLVDTCASSFADYPSSKGFHESEDYVKYTEDIFVGYRYFETIPNKKRCVVYPFGHGLSYTTFAMSNINAYRSSKKILVSLSVTNTGDRAGKEVVQLYYSAPTGKLSKSARELCGFAKTKLLAPGESQDLCITFAINDMASYDDCGVIAKSCYVLEKG